jgi:predicted glycoside hydrolase/deacetylase ChbG (UPF0249 family)
LIINADGYGFTYGINRGIEEAVERGVVSSISVNANFPAVEELPAFVQRYPHISVGVHLNPVVGRPLCDPTEVPTLVNSSGEFHYKDFTRRLMRGLLNPEEMRRELVRQIQHVRDLGAQVSHLDSHQNQHLHPPFFKLFVQLVLEQAVGRMRTHAHFVLAESSTPRRDALRFYARHPYRILTHSLARYEMWLARRQGVRMADRLMSTTHTGDKAILPHWLQLLRNVPEGWSEVFCHPAYPDDALRQWATYVDQRRAEISVLTSAETREEIARCGITLKSFNDL